MVNSKIAVTGIGVVSPYGRGLAALESGLLAGECSIQPAQDLYPGFVGSVGQVRELPEIERRTIHYSRADRLAILAARDAVRSCGADERMIRASGVVMATTVGGLSEIEPAISKACPEWYAQGGHIRAASYSVARVTESVCEQLETTGPSFSVSVACASGAMSIALAAEMLCDGAAPMMLAGGSDALCPFVLAGFNSLRALDQQPCRPFDVNRQGLNLGEAAAVLVLEKLEHALERRAKIFSVLRGWALNNDAFHPTAPHKEGIGLAQCVRDALKMAGTNVNEIGYVNAHGTGTPLNDIAEMKAYDLAFVERAEPMPVSSTKSYTGHCIGAAGSLEAAITISAIRHHALFPTLRLESPIASGHVRLLRGNIERSPMSMAMSVSAGFGGSNSALIFQAAEMEGA